MCGALAGWPAVSAGAGALSAGTWATLVYFGQSGYTEAIRTILNAADVITKGTVVYVWVWVCGMSAIPPLFVFRWTSQSVVSSPRVCCRVAVCRLPFAFVVKLDDFPSVPGTVGHCGCCQVWVPTLT